MKLKILIILICCIFHPVSGSAQQIIIAYENREQHPYYLGYTTKIPSIPGIAVEMILNLEKRIPDIKISLVRYPWKRCLFLLQRGEVDGIFKATFKPERMKIGSFPIKNGKIDIEKKMVSISNSLYVLKGSGIIWDEKNPGLLGSVCAPLGYAIVDFLGGKGVTVIESDNSINCLNQLSMNRISAAALQDVRGDAWLKKYPDQFKEIIKLSPPLTIKPQYIMLSHAFVDKNPKLSEEIWNMIAKIREEEFNSIALKYIK